MAVPNFLDRLTGKSKESPKTYLALVLSDHRVQSAVWNVVANKTEIISLGTPVEWDGEVATTNELTQAVDATISSATEGLELEPDEAILGLANSWVDANGIKPSKKDLIKSICHELSLKPIGYVVISDTIVKYLKMQEGAPPTSLLLQIDRRSCTLSLIELGHVKHTATVNVSDNIASDVAGALKHFPGDLALPSRFIVVSAMENTSDLVQALTAYDWLQTFSFLHTPKIEALPKDVEVHATAVAGGSEIAAALGFSVEPTPNDPDVLEVESEESLPEPEPETEFLHDAKAVGFAPSRAMNETFDLPARDLDTDTDDQEEPNIFLDSPEREEPLDSVGSADLSVKPSFKVPKLPSFSIPSLTLPHFSFHLGRPIYIVIIIALLLISGLAVFIYTVPQATVTIQVQSKPITESVAITLSSHASAVDTSTRTVPATYEKQTISGEETVPATGNKTIGDPARGELTIYNRTSLAKTFLKGTTLSANNLKFTLDSDVTVASKSAGADYVDVPGKADVKVTSSSFGDASNLKAGTEFVLASFSKDSYVAKNDVALTGGNSKDITVISDSDKKSLLKALTTKLSTQLSDNLKLNTSVTQSHYVLDNDMSIVSEKYNGKVGEEATALTGELTLEIGTLTYSQGDIQTLLSDTINQAVPAGYIHTDIASTVVLTKSAVADNGDVNATADVTAYVTPSLDVNNLTSLLKGKKQTVATSLIKTLPSVVSSTIKLTPALPPRLLSLPYNPSKIKIVVEPIQ